MAELDQQLALIVRADSELAEPLANALGSAGARLVVVDTEAKVAAQLATRLRQRGYETLACDCQPNASSVQAALDAVAEAEGVPDILITCPIDPTVRPSTEVTEAELRATVDANLIHTFLWCQAVGRRMVEQRRGVIVNVTGLSGMGGWPGWLADSIAFGGVHNLTHTLAAEWTRYGVRVNCLVPGVTEKMVPYLLKTPEATDREAVLRRIPAGRFATADDLGKALIYLVRPLASFISGEILRVDGAWDVWGRYYAVDPAARR